MLVPGVLAISVSLAFCGTNEGHAYEKVNYSDCTLQIGGTKLKPVAVHSQWQQEVVSGEHRLVIRENAVIFLNKASGKEQALVKSPSAMKLLGVSKHIACFLDVEGVKFTNPQIVRRLDLEKRTWLMPLTIRPPQKEAGASPIVDAVLVDDDGTTVVLNHVVEAEISKSYAITLYPSESANAIWSVSYPSAPEKSNPEYYQRVAMMRDYVHTDIRHLSWLEDAILICAGPKEDILCLEREDGKKRWRVPRIWEYERWFVGAGIGEYYIARPIEGKAPGIGFDDEDEDNEKKELAGAEKKKAGARPTEEKPAQNESFIVGGPLAVGHRIYVAVAKAPSEDSSVLLAQCWIYELAYGPRGPSPVSLTALPRQVCGGQFLLQKDDFLWACRAGSFVKLGKSEVSNGMGGGGTDMIGRIDWYREIHPRIPEYLLSADPNLDALAWTPNMVFRTIAGGYILEDNRSLMHFPISVVDCQTGLDQTMILTVPLANPAPMPRLNARLKGKGFKITGPYRTGIYQLDASGSSLRIAIASETGIAGIEFPLESVLSALNKK